MPSNKNQTPFDCPFCQDLLYADEFPLHCLTKHDIPKFQCVWCLGHYHHPPAKKDTHTARCSQTFLDVWNRPFLFIPFSAEPVLMDVENVCDREPKSVEEPVNEWTPPLSGLLFQNDNLNLAAACVRSFLNSPNTTEWYHVMVKPNAYSALVEAVKDFCHLLPFWSLCEGGGTPHKHLVLRATKPFRFKDAKKQKIQTPLQLVDVLGCTSQTGSLCDFTFSKTVMDPRCSNNAVVARSLPLLHPIILTMLWEGGLREWIDRMLASVDSNLLLHEAFAAHDKWLVRLSSLFGVGNQVVLPVMEQFYPCHRKTDLVLYTLDGGRMYFKEGGSGDDWLADQVAQGNTLSDIFADAVYHPTLEQQKCLSLAKPQELAKEQWQETAREKNGECEVLGQGIGKWKREKHYWKRRWQRGAKELKRLQYKHILLLEQENTYLRMKHENKKQERGVEKRVENINIE